MRTFDYVCPYCRKCFKNLGHEIYEKHIARCAKSLNPPQYSDRKRGRPTKEEYRKAGKRPDIYRYSRICS